MDSANTTKPSIKRKGAPETETEPEFTENQFKKCHREEHPSIDKTVTQQEVQEVTSQRQMDVTFHSHISNMEQITSVAASRRVQDDNQAQQGSSTQVQDPYETADLREQMYVIAKESKTKMERNIQRMQLLEYALRNILDLPLAFAGSRAEGSNDAVSDTDMTYTVSSYKVYNADEAFPNEDGMNILRLEQSRCHPGYCKLYVDKTRQTRGWDGVFHNTCSDGTYLSTDTYLKDAQTRVSAVFNNLGATLKNKNRINGPAVTPKIQFGAGEKEPNVDVAFLIPCANWPSVANEWLYRKRLYGWPDKLLMETIKKHACGFVPIGYLETRERNFEWRIISFNAAERY